MVLDVEAAKLEFELCRGIVRWVTIGAMVIRGEARDTHDLAIFGSQVFSLCFILFIWFAANFLGTSEATSVPYAAISSQKINALNSL